MDGTILVMKHYLLLFIIDEKGKHHDCGTLSVTTIKEAVEADQSRTSHEWVKYKAIDYLPRHLTELDKNIINLGDLEYYSKMNELLNIVQREELYILLNDLAFNKKLLDANIDLDVIRTSFFSRNK